MNCDCMKRKQGKNRLVIRRFKYNFLPTSFLLLLLRKAISVFSVAGSNRYFLKHAMAAMAATVFLTVGTTIMCVFCLS